MRKIIYKLGKNFIDLLRQFRVNTLEEKIVLYCLIAYFGTLAILFLTQSDYIGQRTMMMGYDTAFYMSGNDPLIHITKIFKWDIRHPLFCFLNFPLLLINFIFKYFGIDIHWYLFILCSALMMSLSGILLYKILKINGVSTAGSISLLTLFCSFSYVMLLAVQVDSYVFTLLFTLLFLLVLLKKETNIYTDNLLFLGITGATSTNSLKILFAEIWVEKSLKNGFIRFLKSIPLFCFLFVITGFGLLYKIIIKGVDLHTAFYSNAFEYLNPIAPRLHYFWHNFLSEPLLFHSVTGIFYNPESRILDLYPSITFQYVIALVYFLVLCSIVINHRDFIVRLFLSFFTIDILIHFILGYGVDESQLFCAHWFYFIPILLGLLMKNSVSNKIISLLLSGFMGICSVFFLIYNIYCFYHSL